MQYSNVLLSHWAADKYSWTKNEGSGSLPLKLLQMMGVMQAKHGTESYVVQTSMKCFKLAPNIPAADKNFKIPFSNKYFYLYIGLGVVFVGGFFGQSITMMKYSISAAKTIYNKAVNAVIKTPLRFFDTTPQGRIINRLVKDTETVDFIFSRFFVL